MLNPLLPFTFLTQHQPPVTECKNELHIKWLRMFKYLLRAKTDDTT